MRILALNSMPVLNALATLADGWDSDFRPTRRVSLNEMGRQNPYTSTGYDNLGETQ